MKSPLEYSRKYAKYTPQHTLMERPFDKVMASTENADELELDQRRA